MAGLHGLKPFIFFYLCNYIKPLYESGSVHVTYYIIPEGHGIIQNVFSKIIHTFLGVPANITRMSLPSYVNKDNNTSLYFCKASKFFVICGLPSIIKWQENSNTYNTIYNFIQKVITICTFIVVAMELGSYITQTNLSEKQESVQLIVSFLQSVYTVYYFVLKHHRETINDLLYELCITLRNIYNDPDVERQMIKKGTIYSEAFVLNFVSAMISYGVSGLFQFIGSEGTFVTVITVWPDVADKRASANLVRFIIYLLWWVAMVRVISIFVLTIITTGCLSYQFKHVQSYFYSLNDIFSTELSAESDRENCEQKYEDAFKVGVQLHADTLWCTKQCQLVYSVIYSAQITVNVTILCVLMLQMAHAERTMSNLFEAVLTTISLLSGTGLFMWNAGDITVEAALVPTAMYSSGWQNCRGKSSQRIRNLLVRAISQAQEHVVIRSFGVMEISHQACVSIVKASYSFFSLLY